MDDNISVTLILKLVNSIKENFQDIYTDENSFHTKIGQTFNSKDGNAKPNELEEVSKLSELIKAHATKLGIVLSPSQITKKAEDGNKVFNDINPRVVKPIFQELTSLTNSVFYLLSVLPLFYDNTVTTTNYKNKNYYPCFFINDLDTNVLGIVTSLSNVAQATKSIILANTTLEQVKMDESDQVAFGEDNRLICIGKMWASCDELKKLCKLNSFGVITSKINTISIKLLNDTLTELQDWLEDPQLSNSDDPFDINYDTDDDQEDGDLDKEELSEEALENMIEYVKRWIQKIKFIKLLMSGLNQQLNRVSKKKQTKKLAGELDQLYTLQNNVIVQTDELVSTLFLLGNDFDKNDQELTSIVDTLDNKYLKKICQIVGDLGEEKGTSWVKTWCTKYNDI